MRVIQVMVDQVVEENLNRRREARMRGGGSSGGYCSSKRELDSGLRVRVGLACGVVVGQITSLNLCYLICFVLLCELVCC